MDGYERYTFLSKDNDTHSDSDKKNRLPEGFRQSEYYWTICQRYPT